MSEFVLNKEQFEAATCKSKHLMIVAPPGCGKTEVLAYRAKYLIRLLEKNQRVLALTFTNRARSNLEDRLKSVLGQARVHRQVVVRNFHGFSTQVVLAHGRTIGLKVEDIQLPNSNTLHKALFEVTRDRRLVDDAERMLREVKRSPLSDEGVLHNLQRQPPGSARDLALAVERKRQETNQLHYEDLLRHAQCLLNIPAIARLYQAHFGAVLVDEFQDLSPQQLDLARLVCTSHQTFAGDLLQGIYSWTGAAPVEVESKIRNSCGSVLRLRKSYRSSPKVLEAVNSICKQINPDSRLISAQPTKWPTGGCSASLVLQDRVQEVEILRILATQILDRDPNASVGIISRAGWRREDIDEAFAAEKRFSVRRWDLAIDDPKILALIQSAASKLPRNANLEDTKLTVLSELDPADVESREQVENAFSVLTKSHYHTVREAIRSIRASDPKQVVGPGVHLLNAHTGKGQQFDWVFVVGLEEEHLPGTRNRQGEALDEELRVLLVMLSRARQGLIVTRVKMKNRFEDPREIAASRWWRDIETHYKSVKEIEQYLQENST